MKTTLQCLLFTLLFAPISIVAQNTVTGTVTEQATSLPIPSANVVIKNTTNGTATDFDGNYTIQANTGDVLVFSFVGYATKEIAYNGESTLNVQLIEDSAQLDEVVLIGYGGVKKEDLTGAVDLVTDKDFNKGPILNATQLITGKVAGVSVTSSGAPGDGQGIRIRGNSSLSLTNSPLIIIDGVPLGDSVGGSRTNLNIVNPNDIESFSVLKDASATAIYGSRAANGVIIITTKKGKNREFQFNANTNTTVHSSVDRVDVLTAKEFRSIVPDAIINQGADEATILGLLGNANTNWQDQIYQTGFGNDTNFSALGSLFDVLPMRASIGYTGHSGNLKHDEFKRGTLSLNLSPNLLDGKLKFDINAKGNYIENTFGNRGAIGSALAFDPTQPVYDANSPFGGYFSFLDAGGLQPNLAPTNPVALLDLIDDTAEVRRFLGNIKTDYEFVQNLTATLNLGIDTSNSHGRNITSELIPTSDATWNGSKFSYKENITSKLLDFYLTYANTFSEKHNLNVVGGYSYQSFDTDKENFNSENEEDGLNPLSYDSWGSAILSYFGRLNYDYDNRYLLTSSFRADASSKLNPDDRWGFFPSVAFAWNMHNEDFLKESSVVNQLKFRIGYGKIANSNGLDDYLFLTRYTGSNDTAQYQLGGTFYNTYRPDPFNRNIRWEVGQTFNIGFDYAFFNSRLNGSINYYNKKTKDLITVVPVDPFTNFGNQIDDNLGDMVNTGFEFAVNVIPIKNDRLQWDINFNIAFNDNEVVDIPDPLPTGGISGGVGTNIQLHQEGEAPYSFYVYQQVYDTEGNPIEGAFVDRNGDNIINDLDKYIYKDPYADVVLGFNTSLSYKKWDFSLQSRANIGNYAYNNVASNNSYLSSIISSDNNFLTNIHSEYLNSGFHNNSLEQLQSSYFIQNASFFKIDNISIGYRFDKAFKNTNLRIFGSLQNVATFTKYKGLDPEILGGIDNNFYPRPQSLSFGVNVDF